MNGDIKKYRTSDATITILNADGTLLANQEVTNKSITNSSAAADSRKADSDVS